MDSDSLIECPICYTNINNISILSCGHTYCEDCILNWVKMDKNTCPNCRDEIKIIETNNKKKSLIQFKKQSIKGQIYKIYYYRFVYFLMCSCFLYFLLHCLNNEIKEDNLNITDY